MIKVKGYADCKVNQCYETALLKYDNNLLDVSMFNNLSYLNLIPNGLVI